MLKRKRKTKPSRDQLVLVNIRGLNLHALMGMIISSCIFQQRTNAFHSQRSEMCGACQKSVKSYNILVWAGQRLLLELRMEVILRTSNAGWIGGPCIIESKCAYF